jgi:hypothetical protein
LPGRQPYEKAVRRRARTAFFGSRRFRQREAQLGWVERVTVAGGAPFGLSAVFAFKKKLTINAHFATG